MLSPRRLLSVSICVSWILSFWGQASCRRTCGRAAPSIEVHVVGGEDAEQGAWPWMVAIMDVNEKTGVQNQSCSGYLIDELHVLTAAHCFEKNESRFYSTRIGHVDMTLADEYPISQIAIHEGYTKGEAYDDIALLTLSKDVKFQNFTPICLPPPRALRNLTGRGTTVLGWGATRYARFGAPSSMILQQLRAMPVVSNELCATVYGPRFNKLVPRGITSQMICAGFLDEPDKDSCRGDSGGPLMVQEQNRWYAIGVLSFGYKCGVPGFPGVFTRVQEYIPWINRKKNGLTVTCGADEEFKTCGSACPATCSSKAECKERCTEGCFCKQGFLRNDAGKCVRTDQCPEVELADGRGAENCGKAGGDPSLEGYVVRAYEAEEGAWPWVVAIMMKDSTGHKSPHCTGFLIDKKNVLSAAHCYRIRSQNLYSARIGNVNLFLGDDYPITRLLFPEDYSGNRFYNDIALLVLSKEVDVKNFSPVCLPPPGGFRSVPGRLTTLIGWGSATKFSEINETLKQASAMPVSNEFCDTFYRDRVQTYVRQFPLGIVPGMLCARILDNTGKIICGGSSGSPLMIQEKDRWYVIGLTSFGYSCGVVDHPDGYTKISNYLTWINQNKDRCKENEEFLSCGTLCSQTCSNLGPGKKSTPSCSEASNASCPRGCFCKEGFVRDADWKCIQQDQCELECGISFVQEGFVVVKEDADEGAWPWMVETTEVDKEGVETANCVGFLIDRTHVLSAAHCFENNTHGGRSYISRVGNINWSLGGKYSIKRILVHENYTSGSFYDDIALLTLSERVNVSNFSPICLPDADFPGNVNGRLAVVAGWGGSSERIEVPLNLSQMSAMPIRNDICERNYKGKLSAFERQFHQGISSGMICARIIGDVGKGICAGGSGSPLMIQESNKWYAIGFLVFRYRCSVPEIPDGYIRLSSYVDWIEWNIQSEKI